MEKEIEVGEYIRTRSGDINKVTNNDFFMRRYLECSKDRLMDRENIVKRSKNIIDLIEVGDYVNGNKVYKITSACIYCVGKAVQNKLTINIETILTKEQYEANCYKVEE